MSVSPSLKNGPYGRQLIEALQLLIRNMQELPDAYASYHEVFSDWQKQLYAGWKAKEPTLMYLTAEYCRLTPDFGPVFDLEAEDVPQAGPEEAEKIYLAAAEQGCDLARLWLAYCYEEGRCGLRKEPQLSMQFQTAVTHPVDRLFPHELSFLYEELEQLYDVAEHALYLWDAYQNPDFSSINDRSMLLYSYMILLGLRDVPRHERRSALDVYNPAIEWRSPYDSLNAQNSREKQSWEAWCAERGFLASGSEFI
ncbi:MAG: hypothetical protein IJ662_12080 [Clostridia bacterium]|nr:hypothetical protein [Clostridia bacterium]